MEPLNNEKPVTTGLISLIVACVLTMGPVFAWGAKLQGEVSATAADLATMRVNGTDATHRIESRVSSLEKEMQLRGQQLDRIETDIKELLRRTH